MAADQAEFDLMKRRMLLTTDGDGTSRPRTFAVEGSGTGPMIFEPDRPSDASMGLALDVMENRVQALLYDRRDETVKVKALYDAEGAIVAVYVSPFADIRVTSNERDLAECVGRR